MVDTLRSFQESLNRIPDNVAQLISAQDLREAYLSLVTDRGTAADNPADMPIVIPIVTQDVFVDIPSALIADTPGSMVQGLGVMFWRMDVNGQLGYDYVADWADTDVPAGYERDVIIEASVTMDPVGTDSFEFAITVAGVALEPSAIVDIANQQDVATVIVVSEAIIDVSVAPKVSVAVRNIDGTSDLEILHFGYTLRGGALAS